ncbi:MAG: Rab family GTPase [Candidatus Hodarchaeota archaeon]
MSDTYIRKITMIGEPAVGKTSLSRRFVTGKFEADYLSTIGVDVYRKDMKIDDKSFVFQIWDLGGQEKYEKVRQNFYKGATGAILVFDLLRPVTFEKLDYWIEEMKRNAGTIPFAICGNKIDLVKEKNRKISRARAEKFAKKIGASYFETSAKTGESVSPAFLWISQQNPLKD